MFQFRMRKLTNLDMELIIVALVIIVASSSYYINQQNIIKQENQRIIEENQRLLEENQRLLEERTYGTVRFNDLYGPLLNLLTEPEQIWENKIIVMLRTGDAAEYERLMYTHWNRDKTYFDSQEEVYEYMISEPHHIYQSFFGLEYLTNYTSYEYFSWNEETQVFTNEEYNTVMINGSLMIYVEVINYEINHGACQVRHVTPTSYINYLTHFNDSYSCVFQSNRSLISSQSYWGEISRVIDTDKNYKDNSQSRTFQDQDKSPSFSMYEGKIVDMPSVIQMVRTAYLNNEIIEQTDPVALHYGIERQTLIWTAPDNITHDWNTEHVHGNYGNYLFT